MEAFYQHAGITIYHGDCRDVLAEFPDESVHCVVTSPPYWGLRDYGTAEWEGGDERCDHVVGKCRNDGGRQGKDGFGGSANQEGHADMGDKLARDTCPKCNARRIDNQIGLEATPEEYVATMVGVFREVKRVLRSDGTCWVNMGDGYNGSSSTGGTKSLSGGGSLRPHGRSQPQQKGMDGRVSSLKPKDLIGMPWRLAFALQADGWWLRSDIIWSKPNPMPESVTDRPTKAHEYVFLLTKAAKYFYDGDAIREESVDPIGSAKRYGSPFFVGDKHESGGYSANGAKHTVGMKQFDGGRNRRSVWTIPTKSFPGSHFATFPPKLIEPCILAGTSEGGCCPECGTPWEGVVETNRWKPTCTCGFYRLRDDVPDAIKDELRELGFYGEVKNEEADVQELRTTIRID